MGSNPTDAGRGAQSGPTLRSGVTEPLTVDTMSKPCCERCGSEGALVKLTQIVNDEASKHVLCEECATNKGMQISPPQGDVTLSGLLDQLLKVDQSADKDSDPTCPYCDVTYGSFRSSGLLGCPECYETFAERIASIVRRVHRGERHVGKVYLPPDPSPPSLERALVALRSKLDRAVVDEDFERAAELRDRLRELEPA